MTVEELRVKDVMVREVVACSPDDPISKAARLLREKQVSGIPVVEEGQVVGMVTETDLLRVLEPDDRSRSFWLPSPLEVIEAPLRGLIDLAQMRKNIEELKVRDVMVSPVYTISPEDTLAEASHRLVKHQVNRLPVLDSEGKVVGIIAREDIIRGLARDQ